MINAKLALTVVSVLGALCASALVRVGGETVQTAPSQPPAQGRDLSAFAADNPPAPLSLLFIHHSVGGQLLAPEGPDQGESCIYDSFPSGGGLRGRLRAAGYQVHEASYNSEVGARTDMFDWPGKFGTQMDRILRVDQQDKVLPEGQRNRIVMFKSCFPNTDFVGEGSAPGNPAGPELTIWNARAALNSVLPHFAAHPDTLFVYFTAPPNAPLAAPERLWKAVVKRLLGKPSNEAVLRERGALARRFNDWVVSPSGWLKDYPQRNVVVFDYYNILTGDGASNLLAYPSHGGGDAHPALEGQRRAAEAFVPFLNRAVRYANLVPPPGAE